MSAPGKVIGRLALHPRRRDRFCVVSGRRVLASFGAEQGLAAVTEMLRERGYAVAPDLTVTAPIGDAGQEAG